MVSRVLGFVRDILMAAVLGTGVGRRCLRRRVPLPQPVPPPVRRGRLQLGLRAAVRQAAGGRGPARPRAHFAEEAMAGLVFVLRAAVGAVQLAMPWLMYGLAPGFARTPRSSTSPCCMSQHHLPLPAVHVAGGAAVGRAQLARQVRRELVGLDRAQPHADGGHAAGAGARLRQRPQRRPGAGLGHLRRRHAAAVAAGRRRAPQRHAAAPAAAAHDRGHAPPRHARHSRRGRRRRHADQHRDRHA